MIDGAGNDVSGGQFFATIEVRHEACAIGQLECRPFAAKGFGYEKRFGVRVVKASRMKLVEFEIRDRAACAPSHGYAVPARPVGV